MLLLLPSTKSQLSLPCAATKMALYNFRVAKQAQMLPSHWPGIKYKLHTTLSYHLGDDAGCIRGNFCVVVVVVVVIVVAVLLLLLLL